MGNNNAKSKPKTNVKTFKNSSPPIPEFQPKFKLLSQQTIIDDFLATAYSEGDWKLNIVHFLSQQWSRHFFLSFLEKIDAELSEQLLRAYEEHSEPTQQEELINELIRINEEYICESLSYKKNEIQVGKNSSENSIEIFSQGLNAPLEQTNSIESADIAGDHPLEKICQKFVHSDKYKCWRAEEKAVVNSLISQLLCSENPTIVTTTLFSHSENFVNTVDSAKSSATNLIGLKNRDLKKTKVVTTEIIETKINEDSDIIEPADVILMKAKTETKITARRSLSTGTSLDRRRSLNTTIQATRSLSTSTKLDKLLKTIDQPEIDKILVDKLWFFSFVAAVENLPISITLAVADKNHFGYPLVYVNKQFEKLTGYNRTEVLGKNCRFMTEGVENPTADMNKLIYALQKQQPCHVILTNKTKTNEIFRNYLTIKPIFNTERVCEYILALQVRVSAEEEEAIHYHRPTPPSMALNKKLTDSIPTILPMDEI